MNVNEDNLIEKVKKGQVEAFGELMELHMRRIRAFIALNAPVPHLIDEVAHESFVFAYRHIEDFETGTQNTALWSTYESASAGRIRFDFDYSSIVTNGSYALAMDVDTNGTEIANILYTNKDFTGASNIVLNFWQFDSEDEEVLP